MIERIDGIIAHLKETREILSQAEFADKIGIKASQMSEMLNGKRTISERTIHKISQSFPCINSVWLLTGEGKMLKTEQSNIKQEDEQCDCPMHSLAESVAKIAESVALLAKGNIELIQQQSKLVEMLYNIKVKGE